MADTVGQQISVEFVAPLSVWAGTEIGGGWWCEELRAERPAAGLQPLARVLALPFCSTILLLPFGWSKCGW